MLNTQEHIEILAQFEGDMRSCLGSPRIRTDKEPKEHWKHGNIYQDGVTNQLFIVYRYGYAFGKCVGRESSSNQQGMLDR